MTSPSISSLAPLLSLHSVQLGYDAGHPLLTDVTLDVGTGWTGVVGANGAGKSTLLRALEGTLAPLCGTLHRAASVTLRCPQVLPEAPPRELSELADSWERAALRLRRTLELEPEQLERWASLSLGERRRWQIGAALFAEPELLLLDEPTNHLDGPTQELLLRRLEGHGGAGVVVSHDRALLDRLCARIFWVERGRVHVYSGGYTSAAAARQLDATTRDRALDAAQIEARRLAKTLADQRRRLAAAERNRSSAARMKSSRDHDARGSLAKGMAQMGAAHHARAARVTAERHRRAEQAREELRTEKARGGAVHFDVARGGARRVIEFVRPALYAGDVLVVEDLSLCLERGERVWLRGSNGAGKSTLLRALAAAWTHDPEQLLYLPQDLGEGDTRALGERLRALPADERGRLLTLAARLELDPVDVLAGRPPSPGVARKLWLADGLRRGASCLLLDEPENHLDLPSVQRLQDALSDFPGALVLITHDAQLGEAICPLQWRLEAGTLRR